MSLLKASPFEVFCISTYWWRTNCFPSSWKHDGKHLVWKRWSQRFTVIDGKQMLKCSMNRHLFWTLDGFCFIVVKIVYSNCWNECSFTVVKIVDSNCFNDCNLNAFNYVYMYVDMVKSICSNSNQPSEGAGRAGLGTSETVDLQVYSRSRRSMHKQDVQQAGLKCMTVIDSWWQLFSLIKCYSVQKAFFKKASDKVR